MEILQFDQINMEGLLESSIHLATNYGLRIIGGVILLIIGFWLASRLSSILYKLMKRREVDPSLRSFLRSLLGIALKIMVVVSVLILVGVPETSFIAVLGAMGLAIGLALSGTLQNFAGGVLILILKPFKVDDFIEAQGHMGTVKEITIFNTIIHTIENLVVTIPNGGLATGIVTNFSANETRRGQWVFSIAYGESYPKARTVLQQILKEDTRVLTEPEPTIFLSDLNDSSVDITVRAWARSEDFWPLSFEIREKVYQAFAHAGITIPFPQMDVHLHQKK